VSVLRISMEKRVIDQLISIALNYTELQTITATTNCGNDIKSSFNRCLFYETKSSTFITSLTLLWGSRRGVRADSHYTPRFRSVVERHHSFLEMFTLTGTSPSRLSSVPLPLPSENV